MTSLLTFCLPWFPLMGANPLPRADRGGPPRLAFSQLVSHSRIMNPPQSHAARPAGRQLGASFLTSVRAISGPRGYAGGSLPRSGLVGGLAGVGAARVGWGAGSEVGGPAMAGGARRRLSTRQGTINPDSPWAYLDPDEVGFMSEEDGEPFLPLSCLWDVGLILEAAHRGVGQKVEGRGQMKACTLPYNEPARCNGLNTTPCLPPSSSQTSLTLSPRLSHHLSFPPSVSDRGAQRPRADRGRVRQGAAAPTRGGP